jgi:hypothetical protein
MDALFSTAYWPNLHYFYYVLNSDKVYIESHEHYQKQSFRNRTQILSANGILDLTIPIKKTKDNELISTVEISYAEQWQIKHWRAITSAYKNSPYFEFFEDDIREFYSGNHHLLLDYNTAQLKTILRILKLKKEIVLTSEFEKTVDKNDLREKIHPKKDQELINGLNKPYYQTFGDKFGFVPNLSILDLLLNEGLQTLSYFPKETFTL